MPNPDFRPPENTDLIPLDDVLRAVLSQCPRLTSVEISTLDALGMVLAEDAVAVAAVPPFDNSSMDGYAVRVSDLKTLPTMLRLRSTREAGDARSTTELLSGECDAIMTGAAMPDGADTVVPFENTVASNDSVTFSDPVTQGAFVRLRGGDIQPGAVALTAGTVLSAQALASLVACGVEAVRATSRPRVAVITTGAELAKTTGTSIPDSNSVYLSLSLGANFSITTLGPVVDDTSAIASVLRKAAANHDAIVTTGGVGPGIRDLVPPAIDEVGTVQRYSIAMKPGKPFAFGQVDAEGRMVPVFALPGNPVSALVGTNVLVLPALRQMAGRRQFLPAATTAVAEVDLPKHTDGKVHFVPAFLSSDDGQPHAMPLGADASHKIVSAGTANCLIKLDDAGGVAAGQSVEVVLL